MLLKIFTSRSKAPANRDTDGSDHITGVDQIASVLKRMMSEHTLISLYPSEDYEDSCISAVIKVNAEKQIFLLDGVQKQKDHEALLNSGRFFATTRLHGIKHNFVASVDSAGEDDGIAFYRVRFPKEIISEQKREFYRATLPMDEKIRVHMTTPDNVHMEGEIRDLSAGGVCIGFSSNFSNRIRRGMVLPYCMINMPEGTPITTGLEARYVSARPNGGRAYLGARFVDLDKKDLRRIQQLVGKLDRKSKQHRMRMSS